MRLAHADQVTWLPRPAAEPPEQFPSPFDELGPHPVVGEAVEALKAELRRLTLSEGKMFGVLVVRDGAGRLGALRAFSGMLDGEWLRDGFCAPLFDPLQRRAVELPGERQVSALTRRIEAHRESEGWHTARAEAAALSARQQQARALLERTHRERRAARHLLRESLRSEAAAPERRGQPQDGVGARLEALANESRRDKAEARRLEAAHARERAEVEAALNGHLRRLRALERLRAYASRRLMQALHDSYRPRSFRGEARPLRALYEGEPPSGAGDCCGPKLLGAAQRLGLTPVAMAELWWGPPPPTGGRIEGACYPACRAKCGPLLPFMLEGLEVAAPRVFTPPAPRSEGLELLFEDRALVVLHKPEGLLSIPARGGRQDDSVLSRLRARFPGATGPIIVHRLDLDTSGLMVAALTPDSHAALQRQFLRREVEKRYVAVVEGRVAGESGRIDLPLRVDLEDRPRQIHDPIHGLRAITEWEVLAREAATTRVRLTPLTGRTHQLRVHAAHPKGLHAPIMGDRLYGRPAERLHLHAQRLGFTHPSTGERLSFERSAPF